MESNLELTSASSIAGRKAGDLMSINLGGGVTMAMCWIPPGEFMMGSPSNEPGRSKYETPHLVTITRGFWIGKFPVTQRQYQQVMGENPADFKNAGLDAPVESVDWIQARKFCDRLRPRLPAQMRGLSPRLPTEAEWEYACRAGATKALHDGKSLTSATGRCANLGKMAWYAENSRRTTHPVGQKKANGWGLHDMLGNVWEWCGDGYGTYPSGPATDPTGISSGSDRVKRGGSWGSYAGFCRSANRDRFGPDYRDNALGFRVVVGR